MNQAGDGDSREGVDPQHVHPPPIPQHELHAGRIILRDGTTAELREARQTDLPLLEALVAQVSDQSRFERFLSAGSSAGRMARRLIPAAAAAEQRTLVVLRGGSSESREIVAVGSYVRDGKVAEPAFLVRDDFQGRGIGSLLLERLALLAVRDGIRRFRAVTRPGNREMLRVFRASGFPVDESLDDGMVTISFSVVPQEEMVARAELRDRIATVASLRPFFRPQAVAVIGASRNPASIGYRILTYLVRHRFNGPVYPVNPHADVVGSMPAYPSVEAIPGPVDLAVVVVPRDAVMPVVRQSARKGVRSLVVISAGFAEAGPEGAALQDELVQFVRGHGMRMVGPNCLGLINTAEDVRLNASFSPVYPPSGQVAMASQSGALGLAILEYADELGLGLSSFVSVGNKADVSGNDLLQYWEDDEQTGLILLYLESFGNPRRFARLARRVGRRKPILAVKAGRTAAGRRAAGSHTAALAASDVAVDALFQQAGILRADTLDAMFDVAALLANQPLPQGPNVTIITNAGGPGILCADACESGGLTVEPLAPQTRQVLAKRLPAAASSENPVDMLAAASPETYGAAVRAVLADTAVDAVIVIYIPVGLAETAAVINKVAGAVDAARHAGQQQPVLQVLMEKRGVSAGSGEGGSIPTYRFPESAARALSQAYRYARWRGEPLGRIPRLPATDTEAARAVCRRAAAEAGPDPLWLDARQVGQVLEAVGVETARGEVAVTAAEAADLAQEIGFPVAVKLVSQTLVHKTEWDGVHLNLETPAAVRQAFGQMRERLAAADRQDAFQGVLVQEMVTHGVELMVGMTTDEVFGPLMAFGLGGIHVEVLGDVSFRITPLTDRDARTMIDDLRGRRLLEGYRGHAPVDRAALETLLLCVSRLVEEVPEIAELDLNPVKAFAPGHGLRVLDARIQVRGGGRGAHPQH